MSDGYKRLYRSTADTCPAGVCAGAGDYLQLEARVYEELDRRIHQRLDDGDRTLLNRYDPDSAALTAAILAMAQRLKLRVVAEGVETLEQARLLREQGCDELQGYLLSRPLPADAFARLLVKEKR